MEDAHKGKFLLREGRVSSSKEMSRRKKPGILLQVAPLSNLDACVFLHGLISSSGLFLHLVTL